MITYLLEDVGNLDEGVFGEVDECGDAEEDDNYVNTIPVNTIK